MSTINLEKFIFILQNIFNMQPKNMEDMINIK